MYLVQDQAVVKTCDHSRPAQMGCDQNLSKWAVFKTCPNGLYSRPVQMGCDQDLSKWAAIKTCPNGLRSRPVQMGCDQDLSKWVVIDLPLLLLLGFPLRYQAHRILLLSGYQPFSPSPPPSLPPSTPGSPVQMDSAAAAPTCWAAVAAYQWAVAVGESNQGQRSTSITARESHTDSVALLRLQHFTT